MQRWGEISPILLSLFNIINQSYFMSAFFLLAGYFTPFSLERKGIKQFLIDRLIRKALSKGRTESVFQVVISN